jgi:glycosyltransferase involved in cell wall biosynthesis
MRGKVEIAFLLSSLKFGGGERVALNLAHAFKARGLNIKFLLMSYEGEFLGEALEHFEVIDLACDRTWQLPGKLVGHLYRHGTDALISSFWKLNLCACVSRIFYPKMRLLLWEHSPPSRSANSPAWLYGVSASVLYRLSTKIIAVSSGVLEDISSITLGLRHKLKVIFNPVKPPASIPRPEKREHRRHIVWVGRLDHPKNPALMLEAFAQLPKHQGYELTFVGDGVLRESLENRVVDLGIQSVVRFVGFQADPYRWLQQADLLVLTSDREGFGNVLVEAMYAGLSVVTTDCGRGVHEVLLNGKYGRIVKCGDVNKLSLAIVETFTNPLAAAEQMNGAKRFLPEKISDEFLVELGLGNI